MKRKAFVAGAAAGVLGPWSAARATGGRDVEGPVVGHEVRVLLASASGAAPPAEPVDAYSFRWNGRMYRGRATSAVLPDGRIGLIDAVPLDAYLYSVVNKELSAGWPAGALQAQAIVARTYALTKGRPGKPYDVVAGDADQVYGGMDAESVEARAAVDATAGTIVTFAGAPARLAFGSCCGGYTADAGDLWGSDVPYLRGVPDPHCAIAPEYHWERETPYDEFARAFGARAIDIGDVQSVDLRDIDQTGRPRRVALVGARGAIELKTTAFRSAVGTSVVRSTLVQSVRLLRTGNAPSTVAIAGAGRGHGVGLCQWGARGMAQAGADAAAIVQFYFPQTALGRA